MLFDECGNGSARLEFETASGKLHAGRTATGFELDLPESPSRAVPCPAGLLEHLGVPAAVETRATLDGRKLLVRLSDGFDLRRIHPDFSGLLRLDVGPAKGSEQALTPLRPCILASLRSVTSAYSPRARQA
ncbi:MAG: hypothetical protein HY814_14800 [Candidatus Riflebacteria bacterium]|nr:hypothetical protein [Candidatus Riflebacteria bacterium]